VATGFLDMANSLKTILPRTIESLNSDIGRLVTGQGQKGDFGRTLRTAGQGAVTAGLQGAEGMALHFLSGGKLGPKRDGSSALAALYVIQAEASAGASSIGLSSPARTAGIDLASLVPGGSFIQPFLSLLPHFAGGGDVTANHPIMVGENGPEPFIPRTAGTILPTGSLDGGGGTHFHIDARGSNDPAAVNAAVMRAVPHILAAGVQAGNQQKMRSAGGRR
jgi:hypothetical protein